MKYSINERNITNFIDKLGRKQFRTQKKTWAKSALNHHALDLIFGGTKSGESIESFSRWHRA